jgi:hypothetical protein
MIAFLGSRAGRFWGVDAWNLSRLGERNRRWLRLVL